MARTRKGVGEQGNPTRRTALKVAVATAGAGGLASLLLSLCGKAGDEATGDRLPFSVWRAVRDALRESPDHLVARSESLVTSGDALAIFRFVRDEIATYPSSESHFSGSNVQTVRWGWRASLRCGAGTPREKAELLYELLRSAGKDVELVSYRDPKDEQAVRELIAPPPPRTFAPGASDSDVRRWRERLGLPAAAASVTAIDRDGAESEKTFVELSSTLAETGAQRWDLARPFALTWRPEVCAVRLKDPSGSRLLSPLPGVEPIVEEESTDDLRVSEVTESQGMLQVEVALLAATTKAPGERVELLRHAWSADELVGRQLVVQLVPACYPENWVITRFGDVQVFVPAFALQDPQRTKGEMGETLLLGEALSREGERITRAEDGSIAIGEHRLGAAASDRADEVASLEIEVSSAGFPRIDIKLNALDEGGNRVDGLSAADFRVSDDGEGVAHLLTADRESPRVAVLVDQSGSMPREYLGKEMDALYDALELELRKVSPHAILLRRGTDSNLWRNLAGATVDDPAFIVYITDGHVFDESTPAILERLGRGPKALLIGVHDQRSDVLQAMADATGGKMVLAEDSQATVRAIAEMLADHSEPSYRIRYTAPHRDPGPHKVVVEIPAAGVSAPGSYEVPAELPPGPPQLAGLYLEVAVGNRRHLLTLAGVDHRTPMVEQTPELLSEVRAAMFGTTLVSFEAAGVPTSVWLDDVISAGLSAAPLHEAVAAGDAAAARTALHDAFQSLPLDLCQATMLEIPRGGDEITTYQTGLRVGVYTERVQFETGDVRRAVELLDTAMRRSAATDATTGCEVTAARTMRPWLVERDRFANSTLGTLAAATLAPLDGRAPGYRDLDDQVLRTLWREHWRRTQVRSVGPAAARPLAYVSFDRATGEAVAVSADGAVGTAEAGHVAVSELMTIDYHLSARGAQAGTAFVLGLVDDLKELFDGHARAVNMVTSTIDAAVTDARGPLAHLACHATRNLVFGPIASEVSERDRLDALIAVLAEPGPHDCPTTDE